MMFRAALLSTVVMAATGCQPVRVHVNCVTTAEGVDCTVEQTSGTSEVEACWDFSVTCGNGGVVTAPRTCQKVSGGGTTKVTIPLDKLTGFAQCGGDSPPKAVLENLTLDGKAATL
jgi:hypothetical protein